MKTLKSVLLSVAFILIIFNCFSQQLAKNNQKKQFQDARRFVMYSKYSTALPILLNLQHTDTANVNLNYLVGLCYLNSESEKEKAIPFLKNASKNMSQKYKGIKLNENKAPFKTMLHLGQAYHFIYQFAQAENYFVKYKELVSDNLKEIKIADRYIEMCKNGELLLKDSIDISIDNVGTIINSEFDEHTPCLTTDEKTLIFTSRRRESTGGKLNEDGKYFEDIYISNKVENKWTNPRNISSKINTEGHEATVCLSADGLELYIYKDDGGDGNLYVSYFEKNEWTVPEKLESNINTPNNETSATISSEGTTLIFSSDRGNGKGGKDLYIVTRLPGGEWSLAQNIGALINTEYDEEGPFLHPDGTTLYFSSKGHNSIGGYDLFYCELQIDGTWGKPVNMGYPINTTSDDVYYVMSADGKRAYFSSIRNDGFGGRDLYIINFLSLPERASAVIKGTIQMEGTTEIPKNIVINVNEKKTGKLVGKYKPNKENGNYIIVLRQGKDYLFTCETPDLIFSPETISIPDKSAFQQINKPIILNPIGTIRKKNDKH